MTEYCVNGCVRTGRTGARLVATKNGLCDHCLYGRCACGSWANAIRDEAGNFLCRGCQRGDCNAPGCTKRSIRHGLCNEHSYGTCYFPGCTKVSTTQSPNGPGCNEHGKGICVICKSHASQRGPGDAYYCTLHTRDPEAMPLKGDARRNALHHVYLLYFPDRNALKIGQAAEGIRRKEKHLRLHNGVLLHDTGYIYGTELAAIRVERQVLQAWTAHGAKRVDKDGRRNLDDGRSEWRQPGETGTIETLIRVALDVLDGAPS